MSGYRVNLPGKNWSIQAFFQSKYRGFIVLPVSRGRQRSLSNLQFDEDGADAYILKGQGKELVGIKEWSAVRGGPRAVKGMSSKLIR